MWLRIRSLIIKELLARLARPQGPFRAPGAAGDPDAHLRLRRDSGSEKRAHRRAQPGHGKSTRATWWPASRVRPISARSSTWVPMPRSLGRLIRAALLMVVHIRQDFSRAVSAGRQASVQLILDGRSSNASAILGGYAQQIIERL